MDKEVKSSSIGLSRVVLYKHGIGYFERRGQVAGRANIDLFCGPEEIDDMLKSLLVLSSDGGRVEAITYDSAKTLEERLSEFGFDIRHSHGLVDLIGQLKGIPVTVTVSGGPVTGRVLGVDETEQLVVDKRVKEQFLVLFTGDNSFRRIALNAISAIKVEDASLAVELGQQLDLLFDSTKKKDKKALTVVLDEGESKDVIIAYAIPCPIWKTSYRLVIGKDGKLLIQGMAIVDNVQDDDWKEVEMVLVSAAPISFIQPLYDPVQPFRRTIAAQGVSSAGPVVAERARRQRKAEPMTLMNRSFALDLEQSPAAPPPPGSWGGEGGSYGAMAQNMCVSDALDNAFAAAELPVNTEEAGELFEYKISKPVTVPRNTSALIPILQQTLEGERLSLYNESRNQTFPYCTIRLKNTSGLTLESGPVTVMETDAYAGEALLDVLKPDDTRFLPYAVDQGCHVIVRAVQDNKPIYRVRAWRGVIYMDFRTQSGKIYQLENLTSEKKVVFVEHLVQQGTELVSKDNLVEMTQNFYRFSVEIEPKQSCSLDVWEEKEAQQQIWIADVDRFDLPRVEWLAGQNFVDPKFLVFLRQAMEKRAEILVLMEKRQQSEALMAQFVSDQERARENIKTLGATNERYRNAIDQAEDRIVQTTADINKLAQAIDLRRREYQQFVAVELSSDLEKAAG